MPSVIQQRLRFIQGTCILSDLSRLINSCLWRKKYIHTYINPYVSILNCINVIELRSCIWISRCWKFFPENTRIQVIAFFKIPTIWYDIPSYNFCNTPNEIKCIVIYNTFAQNICLCTVLSVVTLYCVVNVLSSFC